MTDEQTPFFKHLQNIANNKIESLVNVTAAEVEVYG